MRALERGELAADDPGPGRAPRRLPRLPWLRAGMPFRRRLWPRARGRPRTDRRHHGFLPCARAHPHRLPPPLLLATRSLPLARVFRATGSPASSPANSDARSHWRCRCHRGVTRARSRDSGAVPRAPLRHATEPGGQTSSTGMTPSPPGLHSAVALFRGCVMNALYDHIHDATNRTFTLNGYRVIDVPGQALLRGPPRARRRRPRARALAAGTWPPRPEPAPTSSS